jgi:molybdenum cofactor biosynthesis enzyme MoaA
MNADEKKPVEEKKKRRKYRLRRVEGDSARLTISLSTVEKVHFEQIAQKMGLTVSRVVADAATKNLGEVRLVPERNMTLSDLEFMISIVKTVGVPLALEELLSLLQKHKSKEVVDG